MRIFFLSLPFFFVTISAFPQRSDSLSVAKLNEQWIASYATKDTATMNRVLADDFLLINPIGSRFNKKQTIRNVGSAEASTVAKIDSATVRVFGNAALVVAFTHFSITSGGKTVNGSNCYSDLYVKRNETERGRPFPGM